MHIYWFCLIIFAFSYSYVFGNSFKNGPFKGMDDIKSWEGADETTLKKAIEYHVDISRKEEAFLSVLFHFFILD